MKHPLLFFLLATALAVPAHAAPENTFETRLDNGLRVIVREDHRAPTVVNMVWYHAGSIDEKDGYSGVAHVLEHMMFKGTRMHKSGEFNQIVAAAGGRDNAFTSRDYTAYFQIVPKRALPQMMALEADRMSNLQFTPEEFASEIQVVMEERRMRTDDNPQARVYEALNAVAFRAHPYRRPIIGWMDDLEHMSWQDAMDWYRAWYSPNNAYIVIVGDVDHKEVFRLAQKYYGGIKPHALPSRKPQNEPMQEGVRRITVKAPAKLPYVALAWKVPKLKDVARDRDPYALQVLAAVLDGHEASRLSRNLVRGSKIAHAAGVGYDATLRGESLFIIDGQPGEGKSLAELEVALRGELDRVRQEGVSEEELARVKTQLVASQIYKLDSLMAQAMEIGGVEASGYRWQDIDYMLERLKSVTAAEVQSVAGKYFNDDVLTIAELDPQPMDGNAPRKPGATLKH